MPGSDISVAILMRYRVQSYDWDWLDALENAFDARLVDLRRNPPTDYINLADVVIIHHSAMARPMPKDDLPDWAKGALKERRGKLLWFLTNEFRDFDERIAFAKEYGVDWIASQLPSDVAWKKYGGVPIIPMPPGLNPRAFRVLKERRDRPYQVGYRGMLYPPNLGDGGTRNKMIRLAFSAANSDVAVGVDGFQPRDKWAELLNQWQSTVVTEAGMAGAKCVSSRMLDAIGCGTVNIAERGAYNGMFEAGQHYVGVSSTMSGVEFAAALEYANSDQGDEIAARALDHAMSSHTYEHRMRELIKVIG